MTDNKAFWDWLKTVYNPEQVSSIKQKMGVGNIEYPQLSPYVLQGNEYFQYWDKYMKPPEPTQWSPPTAINPEGYALITPEEYENRLIDYLVKIYSDDEVKQEEEYAKAMTQTMYGISPHLPYYGILTLPEQQRKWVKEQEEQEEKERLKRQEEMEQQQTNPELRRTGESVEQWMDRVQQAETQRKGNVALAKQATQEGAGQSEMSKKLETEEARARLQPTLAAQRRSGADVGDITGAIQIAKSMGIDTTEAEETLGTYPGNESAQLSAAYRLNMAIQDKKVGQQWVKGASLISSYPEQLTRWKEEEQQRRLKLGAATGEMEGMPLDIDPGGFFRWSENNPEFQKAIAQKEAQMYMDYPEAYPAYQDYVSGISYDALKGGTVIKPFEEWQQTSPLAIVAQKKKAKQGEAWKALSIRARQTARI